jgi:hypothetical protein
MKGTLEVSNIAAVEVIRSGVKIAGRQIPPGTIFSVIETYNEKDLPVCVLSSDLWDENVSPVIRRIEIIVLHEMGILKISNDKKSEMVTDCGQSFTDVNEMPGIGNMSPLPGDKPFF